MLETLFENWPLLCLAGIAALCFAYGLASWWADRPKDKKCLYGVMKHDRE